MTTPSPRELAQPQPPSRDRVRAAALLGLKAARRGSRAWSPAADGSVDCLGFLRERSPRVSCIDLTPRSEHHGREIATRRAA